MARYYRRRYTRVLKPKKKWASNIKQVTVSLPVIPPTGTATPLESKVGIIQEICSNAVQEGAPTPVIIKTGNFKVQLDVSVYETGGNIGAAAYLMYLPEGVWLSNASYKDWYEYLSQVILKHPEWIMAWKQLGFQEGRSSTIDYDKVTFSSRLKRNLNSGDKIFLLLLVDSDSSTAPLNSVIARGIVQFWTCAN